jgi:hypothetical protein
MAYDSSIETKKHINRVQEITESLVLAIKEQVAKHDLSKLEAPEKPVFDEMTPKLKGCTYGSPEYLGFLNEMKVALDSHYSQNSHHLEHFENGVAGMTLMDLVEMFSDFKAASERHADGDMERSIQINAKRFNMDPQLVAIFENTRKALYEQD